MDADTNALNWFEIPVVNMDRAIGFYKAIFEINLGAMNMGPIDMAMFPATGEGGSVGGALVKGEGYVPAQTGVVLYLNANPDLQLVLDRVDAAGGTIQMGKTLISPENGYMAFIVDTEGNRIGLHSND